MVTVVLPNPLSLTRDNLENCSIGYPRSHHHEHASPGYRATNSFLVIASYSPVVTRHLALSLSRFVGDPQFIVTPLSFVEEQCYRLEC